MCVCLKFYLEIFRRFIWGVSVGQLGDNLNQNFNTPEMQNVEYATATALWWITAFRPKKNQEHKKPAQPTELYNIKLIIVQ